MSKNIGFIGLGNMGCPMCEHLINAGFVVRAYDVSADSCTKMRNKGAQISANPRELAEQSEIIITSLPNSKIVEAVFYGEKGIQKGLKPGSVFIDMSSSNPESTKILSKETEAAGAKMLDAPVSGGVNGACSATLAIMIGGDEEVFKSVLPILQVMGKKITYMGGNGAGHTMKVVNNFLSGCTMAATTEALSTAVKAGLDPRRVVEVMQDGTGKSDATERKYPKFVFQNAKANFSSELLCKDIGMYIEVARSLRVPTFLSSEVFDVWSLAKAEGAVDIVDIVDCYERWAGATIR